MHKTKVLFTGASGFVGSAFIQKYQHQLEILGIGRRPLKNSSYLSHDLTQPLQLDFEADVVVHAAARTSHWGKLAEFEASNVEATKNVIAYCEQKKVKKLVYISSSSVYYNDQDQLDITEDTPIGPNFINAYAQTKYAGEKLATKFSGECVVLRPRAIFGPGDTVLFPRILEAAKKNALPILDRKGFKAKGDVIYIENLIDYIYKAVVAEGVKGTFNVTDNHPIEIQSFVSDILSRLALPTPHRKLSYKKALFFAGIVEKLYKVFAPAKEPPITKFGIMVFGLSKTFDVSKSLKQFGSPAISVEEGVKRFVEWQAKQQMP